MQRQDPKLRRTHKITIMLNDYEAAAFDRFCKRYKVANRAKIVREAIISKVHADIDRNYPTLFDQEELDKL
ncbi:MAG: hypothetical protein J5651_08180 [Salinivirgaceae bacterium]|nr:hypothetical protein [Salinivirgaceae bacterium]